LIYLNSGNIGRYNFDYKLPSLGKKVDQLQIILGAISEGIRIEDISGVALNLK